jgi:hypothetical protein
VVTDAVDGGCVAREPDGFSQCALSTRRNTLSAFARLRAPWDKLDELRVLPKADRPAVAFKLKVVAMAVTSQPNMLAAVSGPKADRL